MRQLMVVFAVVLATFAEPQAQDAGPAFEVASLKRTKPLLTPTFFQAANDRLSIGNVPLRMLLQLAYDVEPEQVIGGPAWVDFERYDITAKAVQPFAPPGLACVTRRRLNELPPRTSPISSTSNHRTISFSTASPCVISNSLNHSPVVLVVRSCK